MIRTSSFAESYRRWRLHAVVLFALVVTATFVVTATPWNGKTEPQYLSVTECLAHRDACRGDNVFVVGAYVSNSLRVTPSCPAMFELHAPGSGDGARLAVCSSNGLPALNELGDYCHDGRMRLIVANGYYEIRAHGELRGTVFHAAQAMGVGACDWKLYRARYGERAFRDPNTR